MKASIAQNVRRYRALKGLNQGEAAELAGISRNAYRAIETGASEPRSANLERIAKALDVSVMSLLTEVPVLHSLRFRSLKTLTAQQRALRQELVTRFALWLKDYNELEALLEVDASYLLDDIDAEDPETAASDVRLITPSRILILNRTPPEKYLRGITSCVTGSNSSRM